MTKPAPTTFKGVLSSYGRRITRLERRAGFRAAAEPLLPNRNLIINGNFRTNQRGYVSGAALASGVYGFDRWKSTAAGTTLTFTPAPQGQPVTINAAHGIEQIVERANVPAGTYTLSWKGSSLGEIGDSFGASPLTVELDGLADVSVRFGQNTVSEVQLERGEVATPFEWTNLTDELLRCQRYWYSIPVNGLIVHNPYMNVALNSGAQVVEKNHPVPMYRAPDLWRGGTVLAVDHQFSYYSWTAAAAALYWIRFAATTTRFHASYNTAQNGGATLAGGRSMGLNTVEIWVDAEL